ncbi:MAG: 16S rRNA (guanine(527)-N(7))-methyltransferase RsmG [Candidatus Improbicoccus pseudotrichonymphae]|uniref:Ribosomal RNA small subunit methyltransferase G n=1 Tax=Candidatus Improbicoccus pseudotrichonymphae TaxID=3033792 RepID=A0AA48I8C3_9FIRM|nr:MAG: 16S rRNA (guanine(527)-N(7))-methyltransferase RsmG [Candidatus Improbicoccus pseudotrichonymphae]
MLKEKIKKITDDYNITLNHIQIEKFEMFARLMLEENKKINLTSILTTEDIIEKHFLDSLLITKVLDLKNIKNLIDIGSGAGFPGIPIVICFPNILAVLNESSVKKSNFLKKISKELEIKTEILNMRAEDACKLKNYREKFDLCVVRAVADLNIISEFCIPFVKKGGFFVPYKSKKFAQELDLIRKNQKLKKMGTKIVKIKNFSLGKDKATRILMVAEKINNTPIIYPRSYTRIIKDHKVFIDSL